MKVTQPSVEGARGPLE